jgi:hypothetical protein
MAQGGAHTLTTAPADSGEMDQPMNDDLELLELEARALEEARPPARLAIAIVEWMQMPQTRRCVRRQGSHHWHGV